MIDSHSFIVASPRFITLVAVRVLVTVCVLMFFEHIVDVVVFVLVHMFVLVCVIRYMSVVFLVRVDVFLHVAVLVTLLVLVPVVVFLDVVVVPGQTPESSFGSA